MAFEVHDNFLFIHKLNIKDEVTEEELYRKFPKPTLMDIFHYSFCYAGILTGDSSKICIHKFIKSNSNDIVS